MKFVKPIICLMQISFTDIRIPAKNLTDLPIRIILDLGIVRTASNVCIAGHLRQRSCVKEAVADTGGGEGVGAVLEAADISWFQVSFIDRFPESQSNCGI